MQTVRHPLNATPAARRDTDGPVALEWLEAARAAATAEATPRLEDALRYLLRLAELAREQ